MSIFIDKSDYSSHIREGRLDQVTLATDATLDAAEERAISFIKGYLNARYDVVEIFNKAGAARDATILGHCIDISLYYAHRLINPRKVPGMRAEAYKEAKEWLIGVQKQEINPVGLPVPDEGAKDYILHGSNPKRVQHIGG